MAPGSPQALAPRSSGPYAVSIKDAAAMVGLDPTTIRDAIDKLHLPAKRYGRRILVRVSDLEAWFDGLDDARESA